MSEQITIDIQVKVSVEDVEALRRLASFPVGTGAEQFNYTPEGDVQQVAAVYFGKVVSDAATQHTDVFSDPSVSAS